MAELIIELVPSVEKVRLVNSGTEATMSAIRLARGFTGSRPDRQVRRELPWACGQPAGGRRQFRRHAGRSQLAGCHCRHVQDTIVLKYNDPAGLRAAFAERGSEIAAVIMEPVVGNMGCVVPTTDFLQTVRQITRQHGSLLIVDEVMTGFRVALGGAQSLYGITADLTTLGKIVGGGLPIGAYGGPPTSWITCCRPDASFRPAR